MPGGWSSLGLAVGESADITVRGTCMRSLNDGSTVSVCRQHRYLPGDVVVVRRGDHWNAHRFLGYAPSVQGLVALTQADDSAEPDPAAAVAQIVGRVQCEVRASDRAAAVARYTRALGWRLAGRVRWER